MWGRSKGRMAGGLCFVMSLEGWEEKEGGGYRYILSFAIVIPFPTHLHGLNPLNSTP